MWLWGEWELSSIDTSRWGVAQSFRDLETYQKARQQSECIFKLTQAFPKEDAYSLTDQIRRGPGSRGGKGVRRLDRGRDRPGLRCAPGEKERHAHQEPGEHAQRAATNSKKVVAAAT